MAEIAPQVISTANALTLDFDIIAHNMANVSTAGYKRRVNAFAAALDAQMAQATGATSPDVKVYQAVDFSQGPLEQTERSLDFAIQGKGFFVLETAEGLKYTRNGMFSTDATGQLVNSEGHLVAGKDVSPILIPRTVDLGQLHVTPQGSISHDGVVLGALRIEDFGDLENQLQAVGASTFIAPAGLIGTTLDDAVVQQGFRESSNVKIMEELVSMITVSRLYEANMGFLSARKDMGQSLMSVAMG